MVFVGKGSFFLLVGFKWPMPSSHWEAFSLDSSPRKFIKKKSFRLKMPMVNISWDTEVEDASLSLSLSHGTQMWAAYSHQPSSPTQRTFTCKEQFQFCFFFSFCAITSCLSLHPWLSFPFTAWPSTSCLQYTLATWPAGVLGMQLGALSSIRSLLRPHTQLWPPSTDFALAQPQDAPPQLLHPSTLAHPH